MTIPGAVFRYLGIHWPVPVAYLLTTYSTGQKQIIEKGQGVNISLTGLY